MVYVSQLLAPDEARCSLPPDEVDGDPTVLNAAEDRYGLVVRHSVKALPVDG